MKIHPSFRLPVIEASDEYYNDVHARWFPVPKFWIGDFVESHTYKIRSRVS